MRLHLEHPAALLGLAAVAALAALMVWRGRKVPGSWQPGRALLALTGLTCCMLGLTRPQLGHQVTETRSARSNLFLAVDISRSMLAEDVSPNRLRFVAAFSQKLLADLGDARVALFPFAADGYVQMPLTEDYTAVADLLLTLDPSMTSNQSTDLSQAMDTLLQNITRMEEKSVSRGATWASPRVLLFSDGESHSELRRDVFARFEEKKIPIFTVGVGTEQGAAIRVPAEISGDGFRDLGGKRVITKLEPEKLQQIAQLTGGAYFPASFTDVTQVARQLSRSLEFGKLSTRFQAERELYPHLFILAILCFTMELLLGRWQYALRTLLPWLLAAQLISPSPARGEEEKDPMEGLDDRTKAIRLYNRALENANRNEMEKAAEQLQESVFLSPDPVVKKKALFALGNTMLKMMDPAQAIQMYQEAYDLGTHDEAFDKEANRRISENIVLAQKVQQQMQGKRSQQQEQSGKGKEPQEPRDQGGPRKDYEAQHFDESQKQKIFDLIASEEQEILRRLREKNDQNRPRSAEGKPW